MKLFPFSPAWVAVARTRVRTAGAAAAAAAVVVVLSLAAGCAKPAPAPPSPPQPSSGGPAATAREVELPAPTGTPPPVVQTAPAQEVRRVDDQLTGRLTWDEDVTSYVFSPVAGRVDRIVAEIGQTVRAGDDLALLRSPDYGQVQADYRKAVSDLTQATETLQRQKLLRTRGAASVQDLESAQADFDRATAERRRAELRLKELGSAAGEITDLYHVRSPVGGIIVDRKINPGQEIRADIQLAGTQDLVTPLFTVTDPTRLWVQLNVPEGELGQLRPGQTVEFRTPAYPDRVFHGQLVGVGSSLDPLTRVAFARASVDNAEKLLRAEMYVSVNLPTAAGLGPAVEIPARALRFRDGAYQVVVEVRPGQYEPRPVVLEHESAAGARVVVHGLAPGTRVVVEGLPGPPAIAGDAPSPEAVHPPSAQPAPDSPPAS